MQSCVQFCTRNAVLMFASVGLFVSSASSATINLERYRLPVSLKTITGHLHLLRHYRRQLTLIASVGLGAFISRVIKDSPLTPLQMPPLKDPPRWNFLTIPLHAANPYLQWMHEYSKKYKNSIQNFDFEPHSWQHLNRFENSIDDLRWIQGRPRFRRDLFRRVKKPGFTAHAVRNIMEYFGSALIEDAAARQ